MTVRLIRRVRDWFTAPYPLFALDMFRVLAGLLGAAYFLSLVWQIPTYTGPNALFSHELAQRVFSFRALTFFTPAWSELQFGLVWGGAAVVSLLLAAGVRPRVMATLLFIVSAASYRWNYFVSYLDDYFIAILFFWLILLPTGRTLTLREYIARRGRAVAEWRTRTAPGTCVRLFLINVCFLYFVAGAWKLTSEFWRDGFALFVMFRQANFVTEPSLLVTMLNHGALILEVTFPVLVLSPWRWMRWLGALGAVGLHAGIIGVTGVAVFTNGMLLLCLVLFLHREVAPQASRQPQEHGEPRVLDRVSSTVAGIYLCAAMLATPIPWIGVPVPQVRTALHNVQLRQSYQLFNWIDRRNKLYSFSLKARRADGSISESDTPWPLPLRQKILDTYYAGRDWHRLLTAARPAVQKDIRLHRARHYCAEHPDHRHVRVWVTIQEIRPGDPPMTDPVTYLWMEFRCPEPASPVSVP